MNSKNYFISAALCAVAGATACAQTPGVLSISDPGKLSVPRGGEVTGSLKLQLQPGYHVNSDKPNEEYLIPIRLTWDSAAVETVSVHYPKPAMEKSDFSDKPLSVFSGSFEILTKFRRAAKASPGPGFLNGKLRYQACNDKMCLPPKTLEVKVPLLVE
jgi:DsbC/DsbD-like thiol-disulfide interchange protein